jgi:RHS repeat-associated protein
MAVTNYYTVDGSLVAEEAGGSRLDNHLDALGSIAAQTDSTQTVTAAGRHAAYGWTYWSNAAQQNTMYGWCGSWGYRKNGTSNSGLPHAESYVRARHYSATSGRWTAVDPLWAREAAYANVAGRPTRSTDPTGMYVRPAIPGEGETDPIWKKLGFASQADYEAYCRALAEKKMSCGSFGNCYTYACDLPFDPASDPWSDTQPGLRPGSPLRDYFAGMNVSDSTVAKYLQELATDCSKLIRAAELDGSIVEVEGAKCPKGCHQVRIFNRGRGFVPRAQGYVFSDKDYHFMRQNPDGTWSDKHGAVPLVDICLGISDSGKHLDVTPKAGSRVTLLGGGSWTTRDQWAQYQECSVPGKVLCALDHPYAPNAPIHDPKYNGKNAKSECKGGK